MQNYNDLINASYYNASQDKLFGSVNFSFNISPLNYLIWLYNAISNTKKSFENPAERLVFINIENKWSVNTQLMPHQYFGYAYLEATRMALLRSGLFNFKVCNRTSRPIAIVIHAFFEDVFAEILTYLEKVSATDFTLYVTVPFEKVEIINECLLKTGCKYILLPVRNHGRDVLPFLKILPKVLEGAHHILLKVHTKKSSQNAFGVEWCKDLFEKLLSNSAIEEALSIFDRNPDIGILGPKGYLISLEANMGGNLAWLKNLAQRMGVMENEFESFSFFAGTMFFARLDALQPLMNVAINEEDFEVENAQTDGTLAHAIERVIPISAHAASLATVSLFKSTSANLNTLLKILPPTN